MPFTTVFNINVTDSLKSAFSCLAGMSRRCMGVEGNTAEVLNREMEQLRAIRRDIEHDVEIEEAQLCNRSRTHEVEIWMEQVDSFVTEVENWETRMDSPICSLFCLRECSCWSADYLKRARDLTRQRESIRQLVSERPPDVGVLEREMRELRELRDEVVKRVEITMAQSRVEITPQAAGWLTDVEELDRKVESWAKKAREQPKSQASQGGRVALLDMQNRVHELKAKRDNMKGDLVYPVLPPTIEAVPSSFSASSIVGGRQELDEIRGYLFNDNVGIIGIYGMGGIGKTTLLKIINNELSQPGANNPFDVVIWVDGLGDLKYVSKIEEDIPECMGMNPCATKGSHDSSDHGAKELHNALLNKIQEDIAKRLGIKGLSASGPDRAKQLYNALLKKRFLLLLDDLWVKLDLVEEVGVPLPNKTNKCKAVLTTRSSEVCSQMDATKVRMNQLNPIESLKLFCSHINKEVDLDHLIIEENMKKIVARCSGLPLTLKVVGRAMADAKTPSEWEYAQQQYPDNSLGDMATVYSILKVSFDRLKDDKLGSCFLYCALFPEDCEIDIEDLTEKWMGEGLLDGRCHDEDDPRKKGRSYIERLKKVCLLESIEEGRYSYGHCSSDRERFVRMHDVIREMALGLTTNGGRSYAQVTTVDQSWGEAKRVSIRSGVIIKWPIEMPECRNLQTLLMRRTNLKPIPPHIFSSMVQLRVLDLSNTDIEVLPPSISLLVQLRYLNLSRTCIESLPKELASLVELRQLQFEETVTLKRIPRWVILSLTKLQTMNMSHTSYTWGSMRAGSEYWGGCGSMQTMGEQVTLKDMKCLEQLNDLRLSVHSLPSLEVLSGSARLQRSTTYLEISEVRGWISSSRTAQQDWSSSIFDAMDRLQKLEIITCPQLKELRFNSGQLPRLESLKLYGLPIEKVNVDGSQRSHLPIQCLRDLFIHQCATLRDITWVSRLPCLQKIRLMNCDGMEEVVAEDLMMGEEREHGTVEWDVDRVDCGFTFRRLEYMELYGMKNLRSICRYPLCLPCLEILVVGCCPALKRLPLVHQLYPMKLRWINCEREWWDGLEWDQESGDPVKSSLETYLNFFPQ